MPLRESPGLVLCALFTLRFEAPYILPWVAHHRLLGVDRLLLYHDDASGMWSPSLSERRRRCAACGRAWCGATC